MQSVGSFKINAQCALLAVQCCGAAGVSGHVMCAVTAKLSVLRPGSYSELIGVGLVGSSCACVQTFLNGLACCLWTDQLHACDLLLLLYCVHGLQDNSPYSATVASQHIVYIHPMPSYMLL
jgi:hypothetical protein